ncbi:MAG: hypothetical protein H7Y20_19240, partial [Bryobacteraceae bacterium]|nr:hypothetical protein [Bryobacteraceae bacterium]
MCRNATIILTVGLLIFATPLALAQANNSASEPWRRIGTTSLSLGLASEASGPVERAWFSRDGKTIFARTKAGQTWQTSDLEKWTSAPGVELPSAENLSLAYPEAGAKAVAHPLQSGRVYGAGRFAWRSDDNGAHWTNLTAIEGRSILGGALSDLSVSPVNPDELLVAGESGVWRSVDGGASWAGLNDQLPNLPAQRLLALPDSDPSTRIQLNGGGEVVWSSGEHSGWRLSTDLVQTRERALLSSLAGVFGTATVTTAVRSGDSIWAGSADARLMVSADRGRSWRESPPVAGAGAIERIYVDARDARFAVAVSTSRQIGRVLRTTNGGVFWDDITSDLPPGAVYGITADRLTGAVYVAGDAGVFQTYTDALGASPATPWIRLRAEPARDAMLDAAGNQLYVALDGLGIFAAMAPHRMRDPKVVSAGDRVLRAAAPGSLLSVIGARIDSARVGDRSAAVLASGESESQIQLPYDLTGSSVLVSMASSVGRIQIGLPLTTASPSIFVDRDGNPLITNADTGLLLDAATPARSNARLQILATGLGRVTPAWLAGLPAPLQDPPKVIATVKAWLDRS